MTSAPTPNHSAPDSSVKVRKFFFYLPIILLAVFLVVFSVANRESVVLSLSPLPWVIESPLFLVFFLGIFLGVIITWIALAPDRWRAKRDAKAAEKKASTAQEEVRSLRAEIDRPAPPAQS